MVKKWLGIAGLMLFGSPFMNAMDWDGQLIGAVQDGNLGKVKRALKHSANPDAKGGFPFEREVLFLAIQNGYEDIACYLINNGANINILTGSMETPLHWAAQGGLLEVFQLLLEKGASINAVNLSRQTPFDVATLEVRKIFEEYEKKRKKTERPKEEKPKVEKIEISKKEIKDTYQELIDDFSSGLRGGLILNRVNFIDERLSTYIPDLRFPVLFKFLLYNNTFSLKDKLSFIKNNIPQANEHDRQILDFFDHIFKTEAKALEHNWKALGHIYFPYGLDTELEAGSLLGIASDLNNKPAKNFLRVEGAKKVFIKKPAPKAVKLSPSEQQAWQALKLEPAANPYQILGVQEGTEKRTVDSAYKRLSLKWHPDKNPTQKELATEVFRIIKNASDKIYNERGW